MLTGGYAGVVGLLESETPLSALEHGHRVVVRPLELWHFSGGEPGQDSPEVDLQVVGDAVDQGMIALDERHSRDRFQPRYAFSGQPDELAACGGNLDRMSRRLGMPRSTLRYRLRIHGLKPDRD